MRLYQFRRMGAALLFIPPCHFLLQLVRGRDQRYSKAFHYVDTLMLAPEQFRCRLKSVSRCLLP